MSWELVGQITILWCLFILGCTSIIQDIKKPTIVQLKNADLVKTEEK